MTTKVETIKIQAQTPFSLLDLKEVWKYRELFYILSWRDIKVRYKQTFLGVAWAVLQPITTTAIFTLFFSNFTNVSSSKLPYSLFVYSGLVYWNFFSSALTNATNSLVSNQRLIKKIYFPRIILPLASIMTSSVDFVVNLILLIGVSFYLGFGPSLEAIWILPISFLISFIAAAGLGIMLASINVKYRDVRYVIPFFIQLLIFLSPVIYPSEAVGQHSKWIMALNPMTGIIEAVRSVFSPTLTFSSQQYIFSIILSLVLVFLGLIYFQHIKKFLSDLL